MDSSKMATPQNFTRPPGDVGDLLGKNSSSWYMFVPTAILVYLSLVQILRFRAVRALERKYAAYIEDPYKLNYRQAAEIMRLHQLYDTPFLFYFGTQWALVKSYGMSTGTPSSSARGSSATPPASADEPKTRLSY